MSDHLLIPSQVADALMDTVGHKRILTSAHRGIVVNGNVDGRVTIRRAEEDSADEEEYGRIAGLQLGVGSEVVYLDTDMGPIILGLLSYAAISEFRFDADLAIIDVATGNSVIGLYKTYGVEVEQGRWLKGWSGVAGVGSPNFQINGSDGSAVFSGGVNTPYGFTHSSNSATTGSSTDSTNFATNITTDIVLPTGTWTVMMWGTGFYRHGTSGSTVDQRCRIDGTQGGINNIGAPAAADNDYATISCAQTLGGRSGTITVELIYKPNSGSTAVTAKGGSLAGIAFRTA